MSPSVAVTSTSNPRRRARGPAPSLVHERPHWQAGTVVAGVDEVGRGAWAGPVTFAAVVLSRERRLYKLRDSKLLTPSERDHLQRRIRASAVGVGLGHASNAEIDQLGMSAAMRLAARRAVDALPVRPQALLLDGNWDFLAEYDTCNELLVGGDARCASIAAASIVAKVARDRLMIEEHDEHPAYAFASNKGYPAPAHLEALATHGPCSLHRTSWAPIAALGQPRMFPVDAATPSANAATPRADAATPIRTPAHA